MKRAVLRAAFLIPLLAAVAASGEGSLSGLPPALVAAAFIAYGRLASLAMGKRGEEEAILMLECLPFAAFACFQGSSLGLFECLALTAAMAALAAGLASLEDLVAPAYRGFALALGFCAFLAAPALALAALGGAASSASLTALGAAGLLLALLTRYAASRRGR